MHPSIYISIESFMPGRHDKFIQLITQHFKVILSTRRHNFQLQATDHLEYLEDIISPLDKERLIRELNEETDKYIGFLQHNASSLLNVRIELEHIKKTIDSVKSKGNNTLVKAKEFLSLTNYRKICLVLVSAEYSYLSRPIVIEAKKKGIPVMNIEHGFFAGSCYPDAKISESPQLSPFISDYVIVNNNFEADLRKSFARESRQEHIPLFLPLGTPIANIAPGELSKTRALRRLKLDPQKKTLSLFTSWVEPHTPLHIFQLQFEEAAFFDFIFKSIRQYPHRESLQIIIKLHPAFKLFGEKSVFDYLSDRKRHYGIRNVVIHTDNLPGILSASDYVICSHFSSVLWEGLENNKPLAVRPPGSFLACTKPNILTRTNELAKHDLLYFILNEFDLHSFLETYAKEDQTQKLIERKDAFMKEWDIKHVSTEEASLNIIHWIKENISGLQETPEKKPNGQIPAIKDELSPNSSESSQYYKMTPGSRISIIIVTYNSLEDIQQCISSIESKMILPYELIVIDNNSTDGTQEYLKGARCDHMVLNTENKGFSGACNQGIEISRGEYIILLNPDTIVTKNWASRMIAHFKEGVGAVGPISNYVAGLQKFKLYMREPIIGEMDIDALAKKTYQWNKGKGVETKLLIGFCLMIKKDVIENIGMLDEDLFLGSDDLEYSWRLRNNGYRLVVATDTFIYHKGQSSFKSEPEQKMTQFTQESQDVLYAKLETHYGKGSVPSSSELWGMDWFKPSSLVEANSKLTSIVILTHNQLEYTKKCIESIFTHTKEPFELIVVDNGSADGTVEYLEREGGRRRTEDGGQRTEDGGRKTEGRGQRPGVRIKIIKNVENLGFAAGNNQGMAAARGDYILLMNNDIVVTPGWLEQMVSCAERNSKSGIVGPMSNYVSGPQLVENVPYNIKTLEGLDGFATKFSDQYGGKTQRILRVVGFCMLIKRAVINKIGGMDGRYGLGNFEDDDFSLRATLAGFESWIAEDCFIHHFGNRTFIGAKIDYRESLHKNWEIFKEKWGMPKDIPYGSYNVSDILEKGFIPEKHHCPLPNTPASTVYDLAGDPESDDAIKPEIVFKKKCKPGMVSIIIPVDGHSKHLKQCVENIKKYTPEAYEIIFVDNGCKASMLKWIRQTVKRKSNYRMIKAGKGAVISKCYNLGMEASFGEYIILLQNHVCVADKWFEGMLECMNMVADTGIVSPMTNGKAAGRQCVEDSDHVETDNLEEYAGAFLERNRHRRIPSREVADFCLLFRRSLVKHIGPFDEELEQGSESDDYCLRVAIEGYRNLIAGDVFVLCAALPPKGNKRFLNKWRDIDAKSHDGERLGVLNAISDAEKLYQREEVDKAIVTLIDGIKYRPGEKALYHHLAEMLIDCERFKEGLETINSIPQDKGVSSRTLELTGYCKAGLDLNDEAAQCADRALSLNGSSAPALNLMGVLAHGKGDKSASEDFFKKAIASDPGYGDAYTNLGVLSWEAGPKEGALEILEKGFILSPTAEDSRTAYFSAISETAEFERAEGVFRQAKTLYPQNRRIAFLLIDILIRQEKYDSAMQDIRETMITFGINDAILSAAHAVLDRLDAQETKHIEEKPALSLCMIVKDEENYLARCLLSAIPVADEIIIVDTGSTDRTKAIAKAFGAKVYDFEWTDDFSEARNLSLSKATGDWIFVLDADEIISPLDYDRLNKIVKNNAAHPAAYPITTRNYVKQPYVIGWTCNNGQYADEEKGTGWYPSLKVRLFSNNSHIHFENAVHESVAPSVEKNGIKIIKSDIPVHHYGQLDWENYVAKGDKYYRLGKKMLEEKGEDIKSLTELAVQAGGEFGKYEEAVDLWKRVLKIDPGNTKALVNMAGALLSLEKYEAARTSSKMAMTLAPDLKEAVILYTTCEVLIGDAGKTIPLLESLLKEMPEYPLIFAILAAAYSIEGEREKCLEQVRNITKMGLKSAYHYYLHDLSEKLVSTGKTDSAVSLLEFAVESGEGTREIRELLDSLLVG